MKEFEQMLELSKLDFNQEEKIKMKEKLKKVVDFIDEIESLDTSCVNFKEEGIRLSQLRDDKAVVFDNHEAIMKNAKKQKDGQIVVPLVVE